MSATTTVLYRHCAPACARNGEIVVRPVPPCPACGAEPHANWYFNGAPCAADAAVDCGGCCGACENRIPTYCRGCCHGGCGCEGACPTPLGTLRDRAVAAAHDRVAAALGTTPSQLAALFAVINDEIMRDGCAPIEWAVTLDRRNWNA